MGAQSLTFDSPTRSARFQGLDGLRGICAIVVLIFHCNNMFLNGTLLAHGYLSVDMFFILSGFVIALSYERKLVTGFGLKAFLGARARRLFPVYWIGTAITLAAFWGVLLLGNSAIFVGSKSELAIISVFAAFLIPNLLNAGVYMFPTNPVAWSLFAEWVANIVYGRWLFRCPDRVIIAIVIVGWGAMIISGFNVEYGWRTGPATAHLPLALLRAIPAFLMGVMLYRWHASGKLARLPVISVEWMFLAWVALSAIPMLSATAMIDPLIVTVAGPVLIALIIRGESTAQPFCRALGAISYPLYAVHMCFVLLAEQTPLFGLDKHPNLLGAFAVVGASLTAAWFIAKVTTRRTQPAASLALA